MLRHKAKRIHLKHPAAIPVDDEVELRLIRMDDAAPLFALTDVNRTYLTRWLPWVDSTRAVEDTRAFVRRSQEELRSNTGLQATIRFRDQLVGMIGLTYIDWTNRRTEVGYWIGEAFQGKGIMTRACHALVDYAFDQLGMNRVEIRAASDNARSQAVASRLGFVAEGTLRECAWLNDRFIDLVMFSHLRRDRAPRS